VRKLARRYQRWRDRRWEKRYWEDRAVEWDARAHAWQIADSAGCRC
jgi:hypothetical protein